MHYELAQKEETFSKNFVLPDVEKIKKFYRYIENQNDKIKNDLRVNLLKDIKTIQYETHPR